MRKVEGIIVEVVLTIRIVCIVFFLRYNPDLVWALGFGFGFIFGSRGAWDSGLDGGVAKAVCVSICIVLEWDGYQTIR